MKVIAVAGDAGGARAVLPVVRWLSGRGVRVEALAYAAAHQIWADAGLTPAVAAQPDLSGVDAVLLGTSVGPEQWELEFARAALAYGARSLAVLDAWTHERERFTAHDGSFVLPDLVAVMDERARDAAAAAGIPVERLRVTGQPALDEVETLRSSTSKAVARARIVAALGLADRDPIALYASQPLHTIYRLDELGYDDRTVLRDVTIALSESLRQAGRAGALVVKAHPREVHDPPVLQRVPNADFVQRLVTNDGIAPRELALGCDLVIGMSSMLLLEACLLGTPTVSYQPGLRIADALPSNDLGWSRAVYQADALAGAIENELFDASARRERARILGSIVLPAGAAERVGRLLMRD